MRQPKGGRFFEPARKLAFRLPRAQASSAWTAASMKNSPPLFFTFSSVEEYLNFAQGTLNEDEVAQAIELAGKGYPPVTSIESLSLLTGYSPRFIGAMAKRPRRYYRSFQLAKRRGSRQIDSPRVSLKVIQKWFGYHLARTVRLPDHVHGFVPDRSILSAAAAHCPAAWVLAMDVADFFPSVTHERVFGALSTLGYARKAAHILTELFTLAGALPQGSPTSPVLANLAFIQTDEQLRQLADSKNIRFSRYADDLCFSGNAAPYDDELVEEVIVILKREGWKVASGKTRVMAGRVPRRVLGLLVDEEHPRLPRTYRHKIRGIRHRLGRGDQIHQDDLRWMLGHVAFAKAVAPRPR